MADDSLMQTPDRGPSHPYEGPSGRTRIEHVRVFRPGRDPLEVEVFRVVNVGEHPDLRAPALNGELHRLDDGERVEVPFLYHDPTACQFVLVIPEGARGRELSERAKLLDSLMEESGDDVPAYVRHFTIAYGHDGLAQQVDDRRVMEVDVHELEPVDMDLTPAGYFPRLAALLPEAGFTRHAFEELVPVLADEALWLFVRVDAEDHDAFTESTSDLLLQLETFDQVPVCVLTLLDDHAGAARRTYLNPAPSADGPILETLSRDFKATVMILDHAQRLLRAYRLEAPRTANAKMMLEHTALEPACSKERWIAAVEACRASSPSTLVDAHPFFLQDEARSAAKALEQLRELEDWSSPHRLEKALLGLSVPLTVLELSRRRILADALRFGLAMSDSLVVHAVRFGLALDAKCLVRGLQQRFEEMVSSTSGHGLDEQAILENEAALERLSAMHGTSTGPRLSCSIKLSR